MGAHKRPLRTAAVWVVEERHALPDAGPLVALADVCAIGALLHPHLAIGRSRVGGELQVIAAPLDAAVDQILSLAAHGVRAEV